jgi:hypothetical protein
MIPCAGIRLLPGKTLGVSPITLWQRSTHQKCLPRALDLTGDLPVVVGRHSCETARKNLAVLRYEFLQEVWIFPVDRFESDIHTTARHRAVGSAESRTAGGSFWLHVFGCERMSLARFAVKCAPAKERIVFNFLQPVRRVRALFVAGRDITGDGFPLRFCLGAFKNNKVACHRKSALIGRRFSSFCKVRLFAFTPLIRLSDLLPQLPPLLLR